MTAHKPHPLVQTDRNLALELVRVTEAAAIGASHWIGHGQKNEADGAAVEAMRKAFDAVAIDGTIVGSAVNPAGQREAYLAAIPEPASLALILPTFLFYRRCR